MLLAFVDRLPGLGDRLGDMVVPRQRGARRQRESEAEAQRGEDESDRKSVV